MFELESVRFLDAYEKVYYENKYLVLTLNRTRKNGKTEKPRKNNICMYNIS